MQTGTRSRVRRARRRDADIPSLLRTRHKIAEAHGYASKADIARIEIVFQHGGIYLDCDMMPLRRFDFWSLRPSLLVCHEQPLDTGADDDDACSTGFFAAPPGHPVLRQAIESLRMQTLNQQAPNIETGPGFFGRMIRSGVVQRLPTAMFYPFSGQEPRCVLLDRLSDDSCAAHMWGGSWTDDADRYWRARALFEASGDLEEASGILAGLDSYLARKLRSRLSAVRRARTLAEWITRPLEGLARCVPTTRADNALRWAEQVLREPGSQVIGIGPRAGQLIEGLAPVLAESPAPLRWDDEHGQPRTMPHRGVATSPRGRHTVLLADSVSVTPAALAYWGRREGIGMIQCVLPVSGAQVLRAHQVQRALGAAYQVEHMGQVLTAVRREVARASHTRRYVSHGVRTYVSRRPGFTLVESLSEALVTTVSRGAWISAAAYRRLGWKRPADKVGP
jgi:hypothetical protein